MSENKSTADKMQGQLDDLFDLYNDASLNDNAPAMERLSKLISQQTAKVREQELYERETMKRSELMRKGSIIAVSIGANVKKYVADEDLANLIIDGIVEDVYQIIQDKSENV